MRSFAVIAFIALVGGTALYVSQRETIARGPVLAADLLAANPNVLRTLECDDTPVGHDGATFWCRAKFKLGAEKRLQFQMDRAGRIKQVGEVPIVEERIDKSDPWR